MRTYVIHLLSGYRHHCHKKRNNLDLTARSFPLFKLSLGMQMVFDEVQVWDCFPLSFSPYQTFPRETPGFRIVETVQKKFTQISKTGIFFSQRRQIWILSYDKVKQTTKLSSSANFPTASIAPENSVFNFMSKFFKILWKTRHLRDGS